jgi:hypothetical protein
LGDLRTIAEAEASALVAHDLRIKGLTLVGTNDDERLDAGRQLYDVSSKSTVTTRSKWVARTMHLATPSPERDVTPRRRSTCA